MPTHTPEALIVNGSVRAGKTTVAAAIADVLGQSRIERGSLTSPRVVS